MTKIGGRHYLLKKFSAPLDISTKCANRQSCTKHFPKCSWYSALVLLCSNSTNIKCDPRSLLISFPLTPFISYTY